MGVIIELIAPMDSPLSRLSFEQQRQIVEWCGTEPVARVQERVQSEFGLTASTQQIAAFKSWANMCHGLKQATQARIAFRGLEAEIPGMDVRDEALNLVAQVCFEVEAMQVRDFDRFVALRKLRQKDHDQSLEERRVVLLEQKAAKTEEAPVSNLTEEQKQQRIDDIMGVSLRVDFEKGEAINGETNPPAVNEEQ